MNLLWPQEVNPDPNLFGRFGRLCHWLSILGAIGVMAIAIGSLQNADQGMVGQTVFLGVLFALPVYFAGRGLRYLFAGE